MNKILQLKIVNSILFISAVIQALTGISLAFRLFISMPKIFESIAEIHEHNGFILVVLILIHLILNWGWIKIQIFKK